MDGIHAIALDPVAFNGAARRPRGFLPGPRVAIGDLFRWSVDTGRNPKQPRHPTDDRMTHIAQHGSETECLVRRCRCCRAQWRRHARWSRLRADRPGTAGASRKYEHHARGRNPCTMESVDAHHCRPLLCISHDPVRRRTMDIAFRHERERGSSRAIRLSASARLRVRTHMRKPVVGPQWLAPRMSRSSRDAWRAAPQLDTAGPSRWSLLRPGGPGSVIRSKPEEQPHRDCAASVSRTRSGF